MSEQPFILSLIAPEGQNILESNAVTSWLESAGLKGEISWLQQGTALEIPLSEAEKRKAANSISSFIAGQPIDYAITSGRNRRKKLLISDMDSTIIRQECIDEIAHMADIKPKVAAITERAMRGELDFETALNERVTLLKDLTIADLETVINERLELSPGASTLVRTMAKSGAHCALVSGGFTYFTEKIGALSGFHTTRANTLEIIDGKLTGNVIPPILGSTAKKEALINLASELGIGPEEALAVGDGANDLEMITLSGLGVAYHAKPIVAAKADVAINHTDLTSLLYIQGYSHCEFATN